MSRVQRVVVSVWLASGYARVFLLGCKESF